MLTGAQHGTSDGLELGSDHPVPYQDTQDIGKGSIWGGSKVRIIKQVRKIKRWSGIGYEI